MQCAGIAMKLTVNGIRSSYDRGEQHQGGEQPAAFDL
jgi:hypothetical protein